MEGQIVRPLPAPKDSFGVEFKVGQYFIKPERFGDQARMSLGKVIGLQTYQRGIFTRRLPVIRTIEPSYWGLYRIRIRRKAILEKPDRAVILWHSQVPVHCIAAFDEAKKKNG
jgi:hypothetical protein